MSERTVTQILREAADHVETVGLSKGEFFEPMTLEGPPLAQRPCCAMGAVSYAAGYWAPTASEAYAPPSGQSLTWEEAAVLYRLDEAATGALRRQLQRQGLNDNGIPGWSDSPSTTAADVAAQLRAAALYEESQA